MSEQAVQKIEEEKAEPASDIIQIISRAASDPNVDIEKMERLLAMRERMEDRAAEKAFNQAKRDAQKKMPAVVRDADNDQTRSKYARLETISNAIDPIITEFGFSTSFSEGETDKESHIRILCDLAHVDGHSKQYHTDVPLDATGMKGNVNKTKTHAYGSTLSYGRRYLKCSIFDVILKGEDTDGNQEYEPITEGQVDELIALADEIGADKVAFCKFIKVESFAHISAANFDKAKETLEAKRTKP